MATDRNKKKGTALVTGASAGIGEAFARRLARRGHDLILVARRRDRLDALATDLAAKQSVATDVIEADLSTDAGVSLVEERLRSDEIELLVNNAGFGTIGAFVDLSLDRELEELDVNVRALMRLTHAALSSMTPRKRGTIINVASTAAFQPIPNNATYSASKAFVLHFSEAVHEEAKKHGVTVTCLCPGPVRTEFQEVAGLEDDRIPAMAWTSVDTVIDTALSAARAGRAIAIPGAVNIATAATTRLLPRFLVRRIAGAFFQDRGSSGNPT